MNESTKRLEEKIAFLERHVTEQDKAMLEFAEQLTVLRREVKALRERGRSGSAADRDAASNDLPQERPPHY